MQNKDAVLQMSIHYHKQEIKLKIDSTSIEIFIRIILDYFTRIVRTICLMRGEKVQYVYLKARIQERHVVLPHDRPMTQTVAPDTYSSKTSIVL